MICAIVLAGVVTTLDNVNITYEHHKSDKRNVVIMAPGYYNSKKSFLLQNLAEELEREFDVILFDFRGHGDSKGLFHWSSKEYLDLRAIINYAKDQYDNICVVGFSMGGTTSIIESSWNNRIDSLVIVSAPSDMGKVDYDFLDIDIENDILFGLVGKGGKGKGVKPGPFWQKKIKPIDIVSNVKAPILYIHGTNDWLIKPWHSENLFRKTMSDKELLLIPDGPHAEYLVRKNKDLLRSSITDWFNKSIQGVRK